jgi:hypothetical protein
MKEVVVRTSPIISVESCDTDKYYGVFKGVRRGFITRRDYNRGLFFPITMYEATNGNHWGVEAHSIQELIHRLLKLEYNVYQFDSSKELAAWLAE